MKNIAILLTLLSLIMLPAFSFADNTGPEFSHNYKEALAKSKATKKPLILIFSASWCPPCQYMKESVYPSKEVKPYYDSFIWAYLDADEEENAAAMLAYGVSGIPHIEFLNPQGESMGHFAGAVAPEQFTGVLDQVLNPSKRKAKPKGSGRKR